MVKDFDVMAAGHLCLDIIPQFFDTGSRKIDEILRPGKLVNVGKATMSTGGPVSNTGINLLTLGNRVCFSARCGDDPFGSIILDLLRQRGNAEGIRLASGASSSYTIALAPPGIDRIFIHNPSTNDDFGPEDLDEKLIARCRHFHFGYPPLMRRMYSGDGEELCEIFRMARRVGVTTSCDMSLPDPDSPSGQVNWRSILTKLLPYVDFFLPSIEECFYMLYPDEFIQMKKAHANKELIDFIEPALFSKLADECLSLGTRLVALKAGHRGFYLRTGPTVSILSKNDGSPEVLESWGNREIWVEAIRPEKIASATGSGDSSIAGFLTGLLRGYSIEKTLRLSILIGWQNLQELDAVSGIKSWDQTEPMLEIDRPTLDARLKDAAWAYDPQVKVWRSPRDRK